MANRYLRPELTNEEIHNWFSLTPMPKPRQEFNKLLFTGRAVPHNSVKAVEVAQSVQCEVHGNTGTCFGDDTTLDEDFSLISGDMQQLDLETLPTLMDFPTHRRPEELLEVYNHYDFKHDYIQHLPTTEYRSVILSKIDQNPVTIIQGSTGSGKTTQIPQFILDDCAENKRYCNILVTQPRKIAAVSIARRVCQERQWQVGQLVGYHVGLDKMTSQDTRLTYVTTGVFLRRIIKSKSLNDFTHVILDEVHERDQETDFAMLLVRKLLNFNSKSVKVILMSATFDTNEFSEYFGSCITGRVDQVKISGEMFTVSEHFAEDLTTLGPMPTCDVSNPEVSEEAYVLSARIIGHLDKLEGCTLPSSAADTKYLRRGSVLVFLPGIHEIREMERLLEFERENRCFQIIPLHSSITLEEQSLVFSKPKPGFRKIILSTNIAESSITVPDIKYVIDFCLTKCLVCDLDTNYQSLRLQWSSKASGKQRSGRAGRVSSGKVFRLVSRFFWNTHMQDYGIPEMQRCSLESAILKVKLLGMGAPKSVLSLALSPPDLHNIGRTILLLKEVGALSTTADKNVYDGRLTFVGQVLASLPLDMRLGKLLMLGYVFGCLGQCLIIAASLAKSSFLATPYNLELKSFKQKLLWANGSFSDCIAFLNAYQLWESCLKSNVFRRRKDELEWGRENFIQIRRIHDVHTLVEELQDRLKQFNIRSNDLQYWSSQDKKENELILKIVMCGAFYPNYFELLSTDEDIALKEMCMLDPTTTVMIRGFPPNCGGMLFKDSIIKNTKDCGKAKKLYYDGTKAFVEFEKDPEIDTGKVYPAVYLASKLNNPQHRLQFHQNYIQDENSTTESRIFLCEEADCTRHSYEVIKPSAMVWFPIYVTHINSVSCFWGYKALPKNIEIMETLEKLILDSAAKYSSGNVALEVDKVVLIALTYNNVTEYYRAIVTRTRPTISVWCVDYGNSVHNVERSSLCKASYELQFIPFQAICFRLRGVQQLENIPASKTKQALFNFVQSSKGIMRAKVYSISAGTVNVDLFTKDDQYINQMLVDSKLCVVVEESKVSELSHRSWQLAEENCSNDEDSFTEQYSEMWHKLDPSSRVPIKKVPYQRVIHGPRTPYESSFSSLMQVGRCRKVRVDRNSINSFAMNQNPSTSMGLLMASAEVAINQSGSTMLARNTTLLPPINGLRSLLLLIFSPIIELRVDAKEQQYTGAICGLGATQMCNGEWRSVLPDHDIEVEFDTDITNQDVIDVNGIRMLINIAVGSQDSLCGAQAIHRIQTNVRQKLLGLLRKERPLIDTMPKLHDYKWRLIPEDKVLPHQVSDTQADKKDFYRLHDGVLLRNVMPLNQHY